MSNLQGGGISKCIHQGTRDNELIDVYQCPKCGTKFLSVLDQEYDYENGFMYETNNMSNVDIEERLRLAEGDDRRRFEAVKALCENKVILDFGCGYGGFLHNISKVAKESYGIELGKDERSFLAKRGIKCFKTIEECNKKVDIITLFHVFEHLSNPEVWLNKLSDYLKTDGLLIIEVPNANDVLLTLYESEKFADFTYWSAHLYLYSIQSLSMLIKQCGKYDIIDAGQVQRYPISNHLFWLAKGRPGGHEKWSMLDSRELNEAYEKKLKELEMCDTLFFILKRK